MMDAIGWSPSTYANVQKPASGNGTLEFQAMFINEVIMRQMMKPIWESDDEDADPETIGSSGGLNMEWMDELMQRRLSLEFAKKGVFPIKDDRP